MSWYQFQVMTVASGAASKLDSCCGKCGITIERNVSFVLLEARCINRSIDFRITY